MATREGGQWCATSGYEHLSRCVRLLCVCFHSLFLTMAPFFFTNMMDSFQNMNEYDDDDNDDKKYGGVEKEQDLFEAREEQQSTPLIASYSLNLHTCCFHLDNKWATCPSSQRWLQELNDNGNHHLQSSIHHGRHLMARKSFFVYNGPQNRY